MEQNPYAAPTSQPQPGPQNPSYSIGATGAVSPRAVLLLNQTRPWWRFFSVLMWIMVVLMVIGSLGTFAVMAQIGGAASLIMVVIMVLLVVMYAYVAKKLWNCANLANRLNVSNSTAELEALLDQQRALWKFVGILTIIFIALYTIMFAVGGAAAFAGANSF